MSKIQKPNRIYSILRAYAKHSFRNTYSEIEINGTENIPDEASVIYAPNHTSALTDPLSVLFMDRKYKVFVARADIFRNPKIAKILHFLKLMPINRLRDGFGNMSKNSQTFDIAVDVLRDKVPFVIFAEGTHRPMHSLMTPLQKGIFRIALKAEEDPSVSHPVCIIPVGIEYGNYFRFSSSQLINIGKPLYIGDFIKKYPDLDHPELMNVMRESLAEKMKELILYIPDDENNAAVFDICRIWAGKLSDEQIEQYVEKNAGELDCSGWKGKPLLKRMLADKTALSILDSAEPEIREQAIFYGKELGRVRTSKGIRINSAIKEPGLASIATKTILLAVTLPYAAAAAVLNIPTLAAGAAARMLLTDRAFINSYRFVFKVLFWPIAYIACVICMAMHSLPAAAVAAFLLWPAPKILYMYGKLLNSLRSDIAYRRSPEVREYVSGIKNCLGKALCRKK